KHAEGDVAREVLPGRFQQRGLERRHALLDGSLSALSIEHPVPTRLRSRLPRTNHERLTGAEQRDLAHERRRADDEAVPEVRGEPARLEIAPNEPAREQRPELRREEQERSLGARQLGVVERFDAEAIARDEHLALRSIVDGEGEHAAQLGEHALPPLAVGGEQPFGDRARAKGASARLELFAELDVVVDLPVEDDGVAALGIDHGLVPLGREIEDGEPPEAEANAGGLPVARVEPGVVRAAVDLRRAHRAHGLSYPSIDHADRTSDPAHDPTLFSFVAAIATTATSSGSPV